jgi:formylglycine-generating enzyme required for sulfatase activity
LGRWQSVLTVALVLAGGCGDKKKSENAPEGPTKRARPEQPHPPRGKAPAPISRAMTRGDCSTKYAPSPERDPNPMCRVGEMFIDRFEVTNAQLAFFLTAVGRNDMCAGPGGRECLAMKADDYRDHRAPVIEKPAGTFTATAALAEHPASHVKREGAERYCRWAGKRLPTDAEWQRATGYPRTSSAYPWGDEFRPNHSNCDESVCKDGFAQTSPVGIFDGTGGRGDGSSRFGVHDLSGNVAEWVADCTRAMSKCYGSLCRDPFAVASKCASYRYRGGERLEGSIQMRVSRTGSTSPDTGLGFRCARDSD